MELKFSLVKCFISKQMFRLLYSIDTIRNGYETLTGSNAKYSGHHVTTLVLPMDAKLIACFVL